jgi:hypothetical protein
MFAFDEFHAERLPDRLRIAEFSAGAGRPRFVHSGFAGETRKVGRTEVEYATLGKGGPNATPERIVSRAFAGPFFQGRTGWA